MKGNPISPAVLSALVLLVSPVFAQLPKSNTGVSRMVITALATHGSAVPSIPKEDVLVMEGNTRDKVADWQAAQGDHAGLELFFLIDDSSSTTLGSQLQDIRKFILAQPPSTQIGVAYMRNGGAQILQRLTADHNEAAKALRLPSGVPGVNASPYFSLSDLIKKWPGSINRREVFMITDGIDRYYSGVQQDPYVDAAISDAQRSGVIVYSVYFPGTGFVDRSYWRTWWGQIYLSQTSDRTGGNAYYIGFNGAPVSLAPYLDDVGQRLDHQYWLAFLPKAQKKASLQPVRVRTEAPNAELVSADRAWIPAMPKTSD